MAILVVYVRQFGPFALVSVMLGRSQKAESIGEEADTNSAASPGPLLSSNTKAKRLESEKRTRWLVSSDEPRDHQTAALKMLWSPLLRPDAIDILFPARVGSMVCIRYFTQSYPIDHSCGCEWILPIQLPLLPFSRNPASIWTWVRRELTCCVVFHFSLSPGQECGAAGMELLSRALRDQPDSFLDSLDLVFKWISLRLSEKENVKAMGQVRVAYHRVTRRSTSKALCGRSQHEGSFCTLLGKTACGVSICVFGRDSAFVHHSGTNASARFPCISFIVQLLQFLGETFDALVAMQYRLEDLEVDALLPTLVEKSGQAKERFRIAVRGLLAKIPLLCSYAKYSPILLQVGYER